MARILGTNIPDDKRLQYGLTLIYGIGWSRSTEILEQLKIDTKVRMKDLSEEEMKKLINYIEKTYKVEGDLREELNDATKRLRDIHCYRGFRHVIGLPARGQRTKSNSRTRKGRRKTVGAFTKEAWAKLESMQQQKKK